MNDHIQPGSHPSPDQLSAFAENALPEHERLAALAHLADCADCRQVVFLVQQADPAFTAAPVAATETPRRAWFSFSQLFGAATAALACSLILALIVHHRHQETAVSTPPVTTAKVEQSTTAPAPPAAPAPVPKSVPLTEQARLAPRPVQLGSGNGALGMVSGHYTSEGKQQDKATLDANASANTYAVLPPKAPAGFSGSVPTLQGMPSPAEHRAAPSYSVKSNDDYSAGNAGSVASAAAPIVPPATPAARPLPQPSVAETVEVAADTLSLGPAISSNRSKMSNAAARSSVPVITLPSKLPALNVLHSGNHTLALDSAGAVFLSLDGGKHWTAVTPQWPGKAVRISVASVPARFYLQQPAQTQSQTQAGKAASTNGGLSQQQAPIPAAGFDLTTAAGAVWHSADGITWIQR